MIQRVTSREINMLEHDLMRKIAQKAVKQPKIALRIARRQKRLPRYGEQAIQTWELNRGTAGQQWALENLMAIYAGQPVAAGET